MLMMTGIITAFECFKGLGCYLYAAMQSQKNDTNPARWGPKVGKGEQLGEQMSELQVE